MSPFTYNGFATAVVAVDTNRGEVPTIDRNPYEEGTTWTWQPATHTRKNWSTACD